MKKKNFDEATLCLGDALASRGVLGPDDFTLLPGHVHELGHHGTFRESKNKVDNFIFARMRFVRIYRVDAVYFLCGPFQLYN